MQIPPDFPRNEIEFEERFSTEAECRDYLRMLRWPNGFACPKCGGRKGWQLERRPVVQCAACGRQTSLTAGTVLHGTRKPLRLWFRVMLWMVCQKPGVSARTVQRLLAFKSYETAWTWLHKLRSAIAGREKTKLDSAVIEADDAFFGGPAQGRSGRASLNPAVIAAVEKRPDGHMGRVRMSLIRAATSKAITAFAEANLATATQVRTDGWHAYRILGKTGYTHERAVIGDDQRRASKLLPDVHRVFSLSKRWLLGTHQGAVRERHLQAYLDEFSFRFNRRSTRNCVAIFHRLAELAVMAPPRSYRTIVASARPPQGVGGT